MHDDDSEEGMMLTEVLVALAILSLVTLAMFRVVGGTTQAIRSQREVQARLELAQELMAMTARADVARPGVTTGQSGSLKWRVEIRAGEGGPAVSAGPMPLSVRIKVGDPDGPPLLSTAVIGVGNAP